MNYSEQLKSPMWQRKRLEIMERDDFQCRFCYDRKSTLTVHHKYYSKDKKAWEYKDDCYICLCEKCHKRIHEEHLFKLENETVVMILKDKKLNYTDIYFFMNRVVSFLIYASETQIKEITKFLEAQIIKENEI